MNKSFTEGGEFITGDYWANCLIPGEYESCIFRSSNFNGGILSGCHFLECEFIECNLSNANLKHCVIKETKFIRCKMPGLHFEESDELLRSFRFKDCALGYSSFTAMSLKNLPFVGYSLIQADFSGAEMVGASFEGSNLVHAEFMCTKLTGADFSTAFNYVIDPECNHLKKARFSMEGLAGLLVKYGISIA